MSSLAPALPVFFPLVLALAACGDSEAPSGPLPNPGVPAEQAILPAPDSLRGAPGLRSVGPVSSVDSYASLAETVGADNLRDTLLAAGEGVSRPGLAVYPGTPEALVVFFEDPGTRRAVEEVVVAADDSPYRVQGLRIGMSLEEAQAVNGQPFELTGLNWDYGGHSRDWGPDGRVSGNVTAVFQPRTRRAVPPDAQGDVTLDSDDEAWRGLGMHLVELRVGLSGV